MKIDIKVTAVHERQVMAEALKTQLDLDDADIIWDENPTGQAMPTVKKAWRQPIGEGVTHRVVLSEDVVVCNGFREIVTQAVTAHPDCVFSLFSTNLNGKPIYAATPYIDHARSIFGCALVLPVQYIEECFAWIEAALDPDVWDNEGIQAWINHKDLQILTTCPMLVQHVGDDSIVDPSFPIRRSDVFEEKPVADWDSFEVAPFPEFDWFKPVNADTQSEPTFRTMKTRSMVQPLSLPEPDRQYITYDEADKKLVAPAGMKKVAVMGDDTSRYLYFRIPKAPEGDDLSALVWEVKYKNADGETGRSLVVPSEDGNSLTFVFAIPPTLAKRSGDILVELCAHSPDMHWHASPITLTVGEWFEVSEITKDDPKYDIIDQLLELVGSSGEIGFLTESKANELYLPKSTQIPSVTLTTAGDVHTLTVDESSVDIRESVEYVDFSHKETLPAIAANKFHWLGAGREEIAYDLEDPKAGDEFWFAFEVGTVLPQITHAAGVLVPDDFELEAKSVIEINIYYPKAGTGLLAWKAWPNA